MARTAPLNTDPVQRYLQEIGRYPLLTQEQEVQLAQQVQRMIKLQEQRDLLTEQLGRPISTAEWATAANLEESELQRSLRAGARAKQRLVESNLRWVVSISKKYQRNKLNMDLLDLLQEGNIGLQRAAEKFDPSKGFRFSTYSYWWIWQAMNRALSEQSRTIRLPCHLTEKITKIRKTQRQLAAQLGRSATVPELADALGYTPQQIRDYFFKAQQPISLDLKLNAEQNTSLGDLLEDDGLSPDEFTTLSCLRDDLAQGLRDLTPKQQEVLSLRYGLADRQPMSLQSIGEMMEVSRERIRQIEREAIKRLQKRQDKIRGYLVG